MKTVRFALQTFLAGIVFAVCAEDLPSRFDWRDVDGKCHVTPVRTIANKTTAWATVVADALEATYLATTRTDYHILNEEMTGLDEEKMKEFLVSEDEILAQCNDVPGLACSSYGGESVTQEKGFDITKVYNYLMTTGYKGIKVVTMALDEGVLDIHDNTEKDWADSLESCKRSLMTAPVISHYYLPDTKDLEGRWIWKEYCADSKHYYMDHYHSTSDIHWEYYRPALVIGWDDSISASSFETSFGTKPPGDGAWIVKGFYGDIGLEGTFYVSYYDHNVMRYARVSSLISYPQYFPEQIHQLTFDLANNTGDMYCNCDFTPCGIDTGHSYKNKCATMFEAKEDGFISALGAFVSGHGSTTVEIYTNCVAGVPDSGGYANKTYIYNYWNVNRYAIRTIGELVPVKKGEFFSLVTDDLAGLIWSLSASPVQGRSFYYDGSKWKDTVSPNSEGHLEANYRPTAWRKTIGGGTCLCDTPCLTAYTASDLQARPIDCDYSAESGGDLNIAWSQLKFTDVELAQMSENEHGAIAEANWTLLKDLSFSIWRSSEDPAIAYDDFTKASNIVQHVRGTNYIDKSFGKFIGTKPVKYWVEIEGTAQGNGPVEVGGTRARPEKEPGASFVTRRRHVISTGLSEFDASMNLRGHSHAAEEAGLFAELVTDGGASDDAVVAVLTNERAQPGLLLGKWEEVGKKSIPGDILFFFLSSHGMSDAIGLYNAPLSRRQLHSFISSISNDVKIINILNACHSGGMAEGFDFQTGLDDNDYHVFIDFEELFNTKFENVAWITCAGALEIGYCNEFQSDFGKAFLEWGWRDRYAKLDKVYNYLYSPVRTGSVRNNRLSIMEVFNYANVLVAGRSAESPQHIQIPKGRELLENVELATNVTIPIVKPTPEPSFFGIFHDDPGVIDCQIGLGPGEAFYKIECGDVGANRGIWVIEGYNSASPPNSFVLYTEKAYEKAGKPSRRNYQFLEEDHDYEIGVRACGPGGWGPRERYSLLVSTKSEEMGVLGSISGGRKYKGTTQSVKEVSIDFTPIAENRTIAVSGTIGDKSFETEMIYDEQAMAYGAAIDVDGQTLSLRFTLGGLSVALDGEEVSGSWESPPGADDEPWESDVLREGECVFVVADTIVSEDSAAAISVWGGSFDAASSVKVYLVYNTAVAADVDLAKGAIDGVVPKGGLKFPLTLNWKAGEVGEKGISIPVKKDTVVEMDEFFTLQLADAQGMALGEDRVCTVKIHDPGYDELAAKIKAGTATKAEQTAWDKLQKAKAPYACVLADPADAGKVTGGGLYAAGKKVTLKATANKGYVFAGWIARAESASYQTEDGALALLNGQYPRSPSVSFTMPAEDVALMAMFATTAEDAESLKIAVADMTTETDGTIGTLGTDGVRAFDLGACVTSLSLPKLAVSGLPPGLKFDAKTNKILGQATKPGIYMVTVKATNASVTKATDATTATFTLTVPNFMCAALPGLLAPTEAYGTVSAGVAFGADRIDCTAEKDWSVKVAGLPAGLKYDAKTGKITGIPTAKPGAYTVTFTATKKGEKNQIATITLNVEPLPDWAVGTFTGYVEPGDYGLATMTVAASGKISGKIQHGGTNWTFKADSYANVECWPLDVDEGVETNFVVQAVATAGKAQRAFELRVAAAGCTVSGMINAKVEGATEDGMQTFSLWRTIWKDKATADAAKRTLAEWEGTYNVSLAPDENSGYGSGYLSLVVGKDGNVKATGKLADGTAISATSPFMYDDEHGYFMLVYAAPSAYMGGSFALSISFDGPKDVLGNSVGVSKWSSRNPQATGMYGEGFARWVSFFGSYYDKNASLTNFYDRLTFEVAELPPLASSCKCTYFDANDRKVTETQQGEAAPVYLLGQDGLTVSVNAKGTGFDVLKATKPEQDKVTKRWNYPGPNDGGLTLTFDPKTGVFKGMYTFWYDYLSVNDEITGKETWTHTSQKVSFEGLMVQGEGPRGFYLREESSSYEDSKTGKPKAYKYKSSHGIHFTSPASGWRHLNKEGEWHTNVSVKRGDSHTFWVDSLSPETSVARIYVEGSYTYLKDGEEHEVLIGASQRGEISDKDGNVAGFFVTLTTDDWFVDEYTPKNVKFKVTVDGFYDESTMINNKFKFHHVRGRCIYP